MAENALTMHRFSETRKKQRQRLPSEKRSDWTFRLVEGRSWIWQVSHSDGTKESSKETFLTRKECVANATRHGYVAWIPEAERRRRRQG